MKKIFVALLVVSSFHFLKAQEKPFVIKKFDSKARISSTPVANINNIYFGNDDSIFYAVDPLTLKKRWSFKTNSLIRSKALIHGDILYLKSGFGVYALDSDTGEKIWSHSKQTAKEAGQKDFWDYHSGGPAIHKNNIFFGFEDGTISGFDLKTGEVRVSFSADDSASVKSGLCVERDVLFFGDWNGKLYAYDLNKNERLWKYDTYENQAYPTFGQINTELTIHRGLLFFGSRNPEFQVIDINSAQKKWSFVEKEGGWISGDPLIYRDSLFVGGSDNHKLLAFDPVSGERFWEYEFLFNNFSKPLVYKDYILLTTGDAYSVYGKSKGLGYLYALNRKNGSIVNFALIGGNLNSTPVILNEHLFLTSEDGFLYKIDINKFLQGSDKLSENGYRAFERLKVDTESDTGSVRISYKVNYESQIKIRITDLSDDEIRKLHLDLDKIGEHSLVWNKIDDNNNKVNPGYYFAEISSGDSVMKMFFKID